MSDITRVALDAMGGDNAPAEIVKGAVEAVRQRKDIQVLLTGRENVIKEELEKYTYPAEQIRIINATEVIETALKLMLRNKICRKSLITIVCAVAVISAVIGFTDIYDGALSEFWVLYNYVIVVLLSFSTLIDCGANVDARPSHLVQFAKMGSIYMESVMGRKNPTVGIVNIGAEEEKGNALVKETFPLLKACRDINFIGSVEAREIPYGNVDVIVCEAFVGNVILKLYEGVGGALIKKIKSGMMSSLRSKIGALLVKPALKATMKDFDASEYGGAPMLGLKGLVVKTHGSSTSKEVCNSIIQCVTFKEQKINEKIKAAIQETQDEEK